LGFDNIELGIGDGAVRRGVDDLIKGEADPVFRDWNAGAGLWIDALWGSVAGRELVCPR